MFSFLYASKPEISVSISPQKYFLEKIVKDKFDINIINILEANQNNKSEIFEKDENGKVDIRDATRLLYFVSGRNVNL